MQHLRVCTDCRLKHPAVAIALACAAIGVPVRQVMSGPTKSVVIDNISLFDSNSGRMLNDRTIVIEGDRIRAIGTHDRPAEIPEQAETIDGTGRFAIPGLIDAHTHMVHLSKFMHVTGDEFLPLFLAAGVTTVRSTGDPIIAQAGVANSARSRPHLCPRVFMASPLIDCDPPIHGADIAFPLTSAAQIAPFVDDMVKWKVTTLKIYAGTHRELGRQVIAEGHRRGLKVTAHLSAYSAQDAVVDGIDCLEHIESVFGFSIPAGTGNGLKARANLDLQNPKCQSLIELLVRENVAVDPTVIVFRNMLYLNDMEEYYDHPDVALCPERMRNYWTRYSTSSRRQNPATQELRRRLIAKYLELTAMLHRMGVTLLVGTDAPEPFVPPGFSMHQELEMYVEAGIKAADVLQAATMNNAAMLGQEKHLGSIEPGKLADLVILDDDPIRDIRNTRKIHRVVRSGIVCDPVEVLKAVSKE